MIQSHLLLYCSAAKHQDLRRNDAPLYILLCSLKKIAPVHLQLFFLPFPLTVISKCVVFILACSLSTHSLMVNYQISHNSLEPLCSYSPTATRTTLLFQGWKAHRNVDTYQLHKVIPITTLAISSQWGIKAIAVCNCRCIVNACINNCKAFRQQQYMNCIPTVIPLNITHPAFIWSSWMTCLTDKIWGPPPVRLCPACHGRGQWR